MLHKVWWDTTVEAPNGEALAYNAFNEYNVCQFDYNYIPYEGAEIWNRTAYEAWVTSNSSEYPYGANGTCYTYGTRE